MIYDYFDGGFYINLDSRIDRKESFEKQIKNIGISIERFPAKILTEDDVAPNGKDWHIKLSPTYSHFSAISEAKQRGWKNCLIFEDDATFHEKFSEKIKYCIPFLRESKWDMFYMGGMPFNKCENVNEYVSVCNDVYESHAYAINHTFFDQVISSSYTDGMIDNFYLHRCHEEQINCYIANELLVWQNSSVSSVFGEVDKSKTYYEKAYDTWIRNG